MDKNNYTSENESNRDYYLSRYNFPLSVGGFTAIGIGSDIFLESFPALTITFGVVGLLASGLNRLNSRGDKHLEDSLK